MLEPVPVQHQAELVCVSSCSPLVPWVWGLQGHVAMEETEQEQNKRAPQAKSQAQQGATREQIPLLGDDVFPNFPVFAVANPWFPRCD